MSDQESLLKKIVEETYQEDLEGSSPISLVNYFEKRLNEVDYLSLKNYLVNEDILFFPMAYNDVTKCYRVVLARNVIDFPSNWSIFEKFHSKNLVSVKALEDEDLLCEIFLSYVGEVKIIVLTSENNELKMIFLTSDQAEKHLDWIENYFAKKIEMEEKKAS